MRSMRTWVFRVAGIASRGRSPVSAVREVTAERIEVVSPATLARMAASAATEPAELEEILAEARHAQGLWQREPFAVRRELLRPCCP